MIVHGKLVTAFDLRDKAKDHLELAEAGILPLTNYYAALSLNEQAAQIVSKTCSQ